MKQLHLHEKHRLWLRVAIPTVISLLLFCYVLFFLHFPSIIASLMDHKRTSVKNLVESAWSILEQQHALEQKGTLSQTEAQRRALNSVAALRYGNENKDYFWINDLVGVMLMHPYRPDLVGKNILDMKDSRGKPFMRAFIEVVDEKGAGFVEYTWQWKDDPTRVVPKISYVKGFKPWGWIIGSGLYVDDVEAQAQGQVGELAVVMLVVLGIGFALSMVSIWQGRKADRVLAASQEKFKAIFDQTFQLVIILSPTGTILQINKTASQFLGYDDKDNTNSFIEKISLWEHSSEMQSRFAQAVSVAVTGGMDRFESSYPDAYGQTRVLDVSVKPVRDNTSQTIEYLVVEGRDITTIKKAEQALRESERYNRALFENIAIGIAVTTPHGEFLDVNPELSRILKKSQDDLLHTNIQELTLKKDLNMDEEQLVELQTHGRYGPYEKELRRHDEELIPVRLSGSLFKDEESSYVISSIEDITDKWNAERDLRWLNEELEMRVQARTQALEKSLSSLKETQDQLVESEKMASLGGLVAGVAHEINTPLGIGVTTTSYLLQKIDDMLEKYEQDSLTRSDFENFLNASKDSAIASLTNLTRASELIQSFKQVAVDQSSESKREFELKAYLDEILLSLHSMYKKTGHKVLLTGDQIMLQSFPGAIMQIITNLLNNALMHAFDGIEQGVVTIETRHEGNIAKIIFSDNGVGMNDYIRKRIYDPFFTTSRAEGGAGLGMHVVYNLVKRKLGGSITCESAPDQGSIFEVSIPLKS